jgi:hypothetical protein
MTETYHRLGHTPNLSDIAGSPKRTQRKRPDFHKPSEEYLLSPSLNISNLSVDDTGTDEDGSTSLRRLKAGFNSPAKSANFTLSEEVLTDVQWRPGFWIRFPFLGISALLLVLCCRYNLPYDYQGFG